MSVESVTSAQNPKIKELLALQEKSRLRRERGLFVVEGRRELTHCIEAGFTVDTVFVCPEIYGAFPGQDGRGVWGAESLTPSGECFPNFTGPPAFRGAWAYMPGTYERSEAPSGACRNVSKMS